MLIQKPGKIVGYFKDGDPVVYIEYSYLTPFRAHMQDSGGIFKSFQFEWGKDKKHSDFLAYAILFELTLDEPFACSVRMIFKELFLDIQEEAYLEIDINDIMYFTHAIRDKELKKFKYDIEYKGPRTLRFMNVLSSVVISDICKALNLLKNNNTNTYYIKKGIESLEIPIYSSFGRYLMKYCIPSELSILIKRICNSHSINIENNIISIIFLKKGQYLEKHSDTADFQYTLHLESDSGNLHIIPDVGKEFEISPVSGSAVLFPSSFPHFVSESMLESRISIVFSFLTQEYN